MNSAGLGQHGGPRDQAPEAVADQVQRIARLRAQHPGDLEDVGTELGDRVARRGRPAPATRTGRAGRSPPPGSRRRRAARAGARSPPCCPCSRPPAARSRGRPRHRCPARRSGRRGRGRCGAARRGRRAAAGRRARSRGERCSRGHRAGPWSPVNLAPARGAAAGSAVGAHVVRQAEDDDRPDGLRQTAGREVRGLGRAPSSAPVAGSRRTKPPSSGTSSDVGLRVVLPVDRRRRGQAERRGRPDGAAGGGLQRDEGAVDQDQRELAGRRPPGRRRRSAAAARAPRRPRRTAARTSSSTRTVGTASAPSSRSSVASVSGMSRLQCGVPSKPSNSRTCASVAPVHRCSTATPALPTAASRKRQPAGAAYRQRMLSPVGSRVTRPVGFAASTIRSVESSVDVTGELDAAGPGAHAGAGVQRDRLVAAVGGREHRHRDAVRGGRAPHIRALLRV